MSDLISKSEAYGAIKHEAESHELPASREAYERSARIIDQIHPVKATPKKKGCWLEFSSESVVIKGENCGKYEAILSHARCSECKSISYNLNTWAVDTYTFCPKCGCAIK